MHLENSEVEGPIEDHATLSLSRETLESIDRIRSGYGKEITIEHEHELIDTMIHSIQSSAATDSERSLGSFTRHKLKTLPNWQQWLDAEKTQLDRFYELGMYGIPVYPPKNAVVLNQHWNYVVKDNGTRHARNCCDGSPRAVPKLHSMTETFSSCIGIPIYRLFTALSTQLNYIQYGGDARDAYAHSPPPSFPCYVRIDDAFADWYFNKYGKQIDRNKVMPIQHALQGHPEAGLLWEKYINSILRDHSEFQINTT